MKSISYGYTNTTWKDLLKTYDGATILYDNSGNPTSYRGDTMQWSNNQLTQQTHNGSTITYTYNESGLRTKKNVSGGTQTTYVWKDGVLCAMQSGTKVLEFSYSANGDVVSVLMRNQGASSGTRYYYARNAQGDVIGLVNSSGTMVIRYTYDSWGKLLTTTGTATIGTLNPFRYRGYIYDTETGFYYLKTRYYNPEVGRFINADVLMSTGQGVIGCNMFCYCLNNPVNMLDYEGTFPIFAVIVAVAVTAAAVISAVKIAKDIADSANDFYQITSTMDEASALCETHAINVIGTAKMGDKYKIVDIGIYNNYDDYVSQCQSQAENLKAVAFDDAKLNRILNTDGYINDTDIRYVAKHAVLHNTMTLIRSKKSAQVMKFGIQLYKRALDQLI